MESQTEGLHGDMSQRVVVDTREMDWHASPSGHVLRKRLHLVGPAESGQVTSLVRYLPGSSFPEHEHPQGEEIFVLKGVFSDQLGDAEEGSHLLNPEGFRHAPFSEPGCLILVKLRQYDGEARPYQRTDTNDMPWLSTDQPGVEEKRLFQDSRFPEVTRLERWAPGASPGPRQFEGGAEFFVIEGALADRDGRYPGGTWLRLPAGTDFDAHSENGCVVYLKTGALPSLDSE